MTDDAETLDAIGKALGAIVDRLEALEARVGLDKRSPIDLPGIGPRFGRDGIRYSQPVRS